MATKTRLAGWPGVLDTFALVVMAVVVLGAASVGGAQRGLP